MARTLKLVPISFIFVLACLLSCFTKSIACAEESPPHLTPGVESIDPNEMDLSFQDDFLKPSVVAKAPFSSYNSNTKWLAHTPWNGDFGSARFADPGPQGPFHFSKKGLEIVASKSSDRKWVSGLICSVDRDGAGQQGFSQKYGYFEIRAKLPAGSGVWPAFWLMGADKTNGSTEIDVLEYYGKFNAGFHTVLHYWKGDDSKHRGFIVDVPPNSLTDQYHNFGIYISPEKTKFYLDRKKYLEIPTPDNYHQPMYILANLALGGGWPIDDLASPAILSVEYIRAYAIRGK
jgi:hypothetical protein